MSRYLSLIGYVRNEKNEVSHLSGCDNSSISLFSYPESPLDMSGSTAAPRSSIADSDNSSVLSIEEHQQALTAGKCVLVVQCRNLGDEVVCFAADEMDIPLDARGRYKGMEVYRVRELIWLCANGADIETLRSNHATKRGFDGDYLGHEPRNAACA